MKYLQTFDSDRIIELVGNTALGLVVVIVLYYLGKALINSVFNARLIMLRAPGAKRRLQTAATLTLNIWKYFLLFIIILVVVSTLRGVTIPAVVITAVLGSALGFGAQSFLRDIIAGFSIIFEGQFAVGDKVELMGVDITGIVKEVGLRITVLQDDDGNSLYIPNGEIKGVKNLGHIEDFH